jgi:hypothetical protein
MAFLTKLPGFQRAPAGLEWAVLRRLPLIAIFGTALMLAAALGADFLLGAEPASARSASTLRITLASLLVLHWTVVLTVALVCVIVVIAKGPAYVADAYPLDDADQPRP